MMGDTEHERKMRTIGCLAILGGFVLLWICVIGTIWTITQIITP